MLAKIVRVGEETALLLPDDLVKKLAWEVGKLVEVASLPNGELHPSKPISVHDAGMKIAERVMIDYAETFKALAKT